MASKLFYFMFGFFNIQFLMFGLFTLVYLIFGSYILAIQVSNLPDSILLSVFGSSVALSYYIGKSYFEIISVFKTSDPEISNLKTQKKITTFLTGSYAFIICSLIFNGATILMYFNGSKHIGLFFNFGQILIFAITAILARMGVRKYLLVLKENSATTEKMSD